MDIKIILGMYCNHAMVDFSQTKIYTRGLA